jgi:hypothetical protein
MEVGEPETRFVRRLESACASVVAVAVVRVLEQAFFYALKFLGSSGRDRFWGLLCYQQQKLYVEEQAVLCVN